MDKVAGIGGFFFRSKDTVALAKWCEDRLGVSQVPTRYDAETYPNGRFARLSDPEGNPIQLWQPF